MALEVTEEQRETIFNLFQPNDWDNIEIEITNRNEDMEDNEAGNDLVDDISNAQSSEHEECSHCLCRPCITDENNRQMWWEDEEQLLHKRNSFLRKGNYKRFWTLLFHRKV